MYVDFQLNDYEIQSLVIYQNASYIYVINNLNWFVLSFSSASQAIFIHEFAWVLPKL